MSDGALASRPASDGSSLNTRGGTDDVVDQGLSAALRAEARGMADAYLEALLEHSSAGSVVGVYIKGSAFKPWDSKLDYVPEFSDVDIHVRLNQWPGDTHGLGSVRESARVARIAAATFETRFPTASHRPRPQLMVVNDLETDPTYMPSPAPTVETLFGTPYPDVSREEYRLTIPVDRTRFLADAEFVRTEVPWKLIDRPGKLAWRVATILTWRVGPAGPRILTQLGVDPFDAWSMNRTSIACELEARASPAVSAAYREFYVAGWDGFRSGFETADPAIRAVSAAERLFAEGQRVLDHATSGASSLG